MEEVEEEEARNKVTVEQLRSISIRDYPRRTHNSTLVLLSDAAFQFRSIFLSVSLMPGWEALAGINHWRSLFFRYVALELLYILV